MSCQDVADPPSLPICFSRLIGANIDAVRSRPSIAAQVVGRGIGCCSVADGHAARQQVEVTARRVHEESLLRWSCE